MDLPTPDSTQCVIGITIPVPDPWAAQVRLIRAGAGDPLACAIPPHVTLLPPTAVEREDLPGVVAHLDAVCAETPPFVMEVDGVGGFRPLSPVVYLCVVQGAQEADALQHRLRAPRGPLSRDLRFPFHPHVTLAHEVEDAALDAAAQAGRDVHAIFLVDRVHLHQLAPDGTLAPVRAPRLTGPPSRLRLG